MSSLKPFRKLHADTRIDHGIFTLHHERYESPRNADVQDAVIIAPPDWVNIVAFTDAGECVMIRQYRFGTEDFAIEIPGGMIDPGESPLIAAQRELREETGFTSQRWSSLGRVAPNPAYQRNYLYTFLAEGCTREGDQRQDPGEDIEILVTPRSELDQLLANGGIDHALVVVAFHKLELLRRTQQR